MFRRTSAGTLDRLEDARTAGDPEYFLVVARKAAAEFPRDGEVLIGLALALDQNEQFEEAAAVAEQVLQLSDDPATLVQAAWALTAVGRAAKANGAMEQVLATGPHVPLIENEALFLRGAALGGVGRFRLAEKFMREALARDDQRGAFIHGLALLLVVTDRRDEALELVAVAERVVDDKERREILEDLAAIGLS